MINFTYSHETEKVTQGTKITVIWKKDNEDICSKTAIVNGNCEVYANQLARDCRVENAKLFIDESEQLEGINEI
jgi:hypothetical protein